MTLAPSTAIGIAIWVWIIIGLLAVALTGWLASEAIQDTHWLRTAATVAFFIGASGIMTLGLAAADSTVAALYVWRTTGVIGVLIGPMIWFLKRRRGALALGSPGSWHWSAIGGTVAMLGYVWLSFQGHAPVVRAKTMNSGAGSIAQPPENLSFFFWIGALALLALGTLIFLSLFVQRLQRGGAPQIETHWGGIGGGLGGWRMSSSLGYLLVAIVLSVMFTVFLVQFDAREQREHDKKFASGSAATPKTAGAPTAASSAAAPSPPGQNTAPNEQSSRPPKQ
jgi:hypothetical protein